MSSDNNQRHPNGVEGPFIDLRWGITVLQAAEDRQPLYDWMLRNYVKVGLKHEEFLLLLHLQAYHYNTPKGESHPSLETIAKEMGVTATRVRQLVKSLEKKEMLRVCRREGTNFYFGLSP